MGKEFGEPIRYDPNFNGPIHNRSCTDILFLIIFILFLGLWGFVGFYGVKHGSMEKLLAPIDSQGRHCGLDSGVTDKKYLVFFDIVKCLTPTAPISGCSTPQVCVEKCPDKTIYFLDKATFDLHKSRIVCTQETITQKIPTMQWEEAEQYMKQDICTRYVIQSEPVLFRCIGDLSTIQCKGPPKSRGLSPATSGETCVRNPKEAQRSLLNRATALDSYIGWIAASWVQFFTRNGAERETHILSAQIVQDLVQSRWFLLGALFGVVVLCFSYILLLRWVVAPVVWTSIAGLFALFGFLIYLCYKNWRYYKENNLIYTTTNLKEYWQEVMSRPQTWMVLMIVAAVIAVVLLLIIIFLRARIVIAIALIKEGSKAVFAVKSTVLFPIFPWVLQCFIIAYGVLVLMLLLSIGEPAFSVANLNNSSDCNCQGKYTKDYEPCNPVDFNLYCRAADGSACKEATCHFTAIDNPTSVVWLQLVNLLGFFWAMFFISGIADMMLASTFSTWYWTFHKRDLPFFTLTSGIYRTLRYHMGTVAFGALIIAIVRVIRVILEYIDHKLKKFDNPLTRCILCFCKCCFWCLESFLKFINKNAYIMCAVHGKAFCASARDAFSLLLRNIVRVVVLDKVTDFIFFLSKLLISVGVGFAVYYLMEWQFVYEVTQGQRLHYNYIPAIILALATYLISTIFFNVYAMAVDTLFLCFLEDCERNDGSAEKPYFMSKNLMRILGKKNKRE